MCFNIMDSSSYVYLLHDGSERKHPFPIDIQLGSVLKEEKKKTYTLT